jgi:hypothetical protein
VQISKRIGVDVSDTIFIQVSENKCYSVNVDSERQLEFIAKSWKLRENLKKDSNLRYCSQSTDNIYRPNVLLECASIKTPWPLVRERTIPTERPPLVDEI